MLYATLARRITTHSPSLSRGTLARHLVTVLLVIFMVAAPLMQQGFPVQLPQSRESMPIKAAPVTVTVPSTFRRDRRVLIDKDPVTIANLAERLKQALSDRSARERLRLDELVLLVWLQTQLLRLQVAAREARKLRTRVGGADPGREPRDQQ